MAPMAKVPSGFQPEEDEPRCGDSFSRQITVTGVVPGTGGYGSDLTKVLKLVASEPHGDWYSRDSAEEQSFIENILYTSNRVERDLAAAVLREQLTEAQADSVAYLINLSKRNILRVELLYEYWEGEAAHPQTGSSLPVDDTSGRASEWPLPEGDDLYNYLPACRGLTGEWVDDRQLMGSEVQHLRYYYCPSSESHAQRKRDRAAIRELLINAARAVRCAEFGLWRQVLYNEAYEVWSQHSTGLGYQREPGEPPTVPPITARPGESGPQVRARVAPPPQPPPEVPHILLPEPVGLPPIPDPDEPEPEPEPELGEAARAPEPPPPAPAAEPPKKSKLPWLFAGAAALLLLPKALK